ncbi:reverse transcriptase domain-containing protein [Cohnella lubricantis]|uniref:reverse transcriptase domain-containing protein n=1 Tax=Cohnella lubricantis TaxID=2163172 RepID=UPI001C8AEFFB
MKIRTCIVSRRLHYEALQKSEILPPLGLAILGYIEEGKYHEVDAGTPQGGVISPLLANLYLNELDCKLEEHGIRFVRYGDDFLLFPKTEKEI